MLKPGTRVPVLTVLVALAVIAYPPWVAEVQNGTLAMGELMQITSEREFLGYAFLFSPPGPINPRCGMIEFACWVDIAWLWLGLELLAVAVIGAVGWLIDRPKPAPRSATVS